MSKRVLYTQIRVRNPKKKKIDEDHLVLHIPGNLSAFDENSTHNPVS